MPPASGSVSRLHPPAPVAAHPAGPFCAIATPPTRVFATPGAFPSFGPHPLGCFWHNHPELIFPEALMYSPTSNLTVNRTPAFSALPSPDAARARRRLP